LDELPEYDGQLREWIKTEFFSKDWAFVYDVVELIPSLLFPDDLEYGRRRQNEGVRHAVRAEVNRVLERELSGYRFIEGALVPVADPLEVTEIESAIAQTASRVRGAHEHLQTALSMLARKPSPDHRNAIKGPSANKRHFSASHRCSWQGAPTTRIRWILGGGATQPRAAMAGEK